MSRKLNAVQRNKRRVKRGLKPLEEFNLRRNTDGTAWAEIKKTKIR